MTGCGWQAQLETWCPLHAYLYRTCILIYFQLNLLTLLLQQECQPGALTGCKCVAYNIHCMNMVGLSLRLWSPPWREIQASSSLIKNGCNHLVTYSLNKCDLEEAVNHSSKWMQSFHGR